MVASLASYPHLPRMSWGQAGVLTSFHIVCSIPALVVNLVILCRTRTTQIRLLNTVSIQPRKPIREKFSSPSCQTKYASKLIRTSFKQLIYSSQCSAADCVLIFFGAAACTAPKFYIFTEANMCVLSLVQCAAQHRHQTILM